MANNRTITASNATVSVVVPSLFPVPFIVDEFDADNPFSLSGAVIAKTELSLDGVLIAGYTPAIQEWSITLKPTSNARKLFVDWMQASKRDQTVYPANFNINIPGESANYTLTNCIYMEGRDIPDIRQTLAPVTYKFHISSKDIVSVII
jgi:hypothetical protein